MLPYRIEGIGPVRFGARGVQHDKPDRVLAGAAERPESALIPDPLKEPRQRVITGIPGGTTLVDAIYDKISIRKISKPDHMRITYWNASRTAAHSGQLIPGQ